MTRFTIGDDIRLLVDRWLDGDLPEADEAGLLRTLEGDAESVAHLADRAVLHGLLRGTGGGAVVADERVRTRRSFGPRAAGIMAVVVACVILGGLATFRPAAASPVAVVQKALEACRTVVDRRYSVRIEPSRPTLRGAAGRSPAPREWTLWVRDGRFVQIMDVAGRPVVWGRDALGAVWFAVSRGEVAVFGADEIPESLEEACDLRSLDLETLLASLLTDFGLERTGRTGAMDIIVGRPRDGAGRSKFGAVEIEVDREAALVRSVVLERLHRGAAVATMRFTLEETGSRSDSLYEWQDHVDRDAEVRGRGLPPGGRRELLTEFLRLLRWGAGET
jgi:hypothetical protein